MENKPTVFVVTINHDEGDAEDPVLFQSQDAAEKYLKSWGFRFKRGEWKTRGLGRQPHYESWARMRETTVLA